MNSKLRVFASLAALAATALLLAGCTGPAGNSDAAHSQSGGSEAAGSALMIGTTDQVTALDPAGSYDSGSVLLENQVYPYLMGLKSHSPVVHPNLAESAEFTAPLDYTVKLKPNEKFANGHELTSTDVKFSFDRIRTINAPNGPASLLNSLDSVSAPDPETVVFYLKTANDQTFPKVLMTSAGPIVDHQVFPADKLLSDEEIVKAQPFNGPYTITSYQKNSLVALKAYPGYDGILGQAKNPAVQLRYYADSTNMKLDMQTNKIDVAWRSLSATDVDDLRSKDNVAVHTGPGGELRSLVFNLGTMPFGAKTPDADPAKALAVRAAVADLIDRKQLATRVYKDTYSPAYSPVSSALPGEKDVFKSLYGDGQGGPSKDKAQQALHDAGVNGPVTLNLQYTAEHWGPRSADEYGRIKAQLEASGLFTVNLQSTDWTQYAKDRVSDVYPLSQLVWLPDYADADNYLSPFFGARSVINNHYNNAHVAQLIADEQAEQNSDKRTELLEQVQSEEAKDISTLPLLTGDQVLVAGKNINGVDETLDSGFSLRMGLLSKAG